MNKTYALTIPTISLLCEQLSNKNDAKEFLLTKYINAIYHEEDDFYEYRGYKFDYFMSGISFNGSKNSYLLVDREFNQLWLFDYGNIEDRWSDFIEMRRYYLPKPKNKTVLQSIIECFKYKFIQNIESNVSKNDI